jgi:hypothetical protein
MEHEEDFYESDTVMHPPRHGDQTYPGSKQVRRPTQAPNSQDEDSDGAGVAGTDHDYQNNRTTRRTAPKRSNLQGTDKQVPSRLNAPVVVSTHPYYHLVLTLFFSRISIMISSRPTTRKIVDHVLRPLRI